MNEHEWLTSTDPAAMIAHFDASRATEYMARHSRLSDRKLRLFACACCRAVWHLLTDERSRKAVEVAERYVDGEATAVELKEADTEATYVPDGPLDTALFVADRDWDWLGNHLEQATLYGVLPDKQAALLREIVGNPWKPVTLPRPDCDECRNTRRLQMDQIPCPYCLCNWLTPPVLALARSAYDSRDFTALPVLWDALSEAGCQDEQIRRHCAEPLHCRGCWLIDCLLGKD